MPGRRPPASGIRGGVSTDAATKGCFGHECGGGKISQRLGESLSGLEVRAVEHDIRREHDTGEQGSGKQLKRALQLAGRLEGILASCWRIQEDSFQRSDPHGSANPGGFCPVLFRLIAPERLSDQLGEPGPGRGAACPPPALGRSLLIFVAILLILAGNAAAGFGIERPLCIRHGRQEGRRPPPR